MKRLSAMILSLLLLWVQVLVMAQPLGAAATPCRCCDCQQTDCCVSESSSTPQPLTTAPVQSVQLNFNLFSPPPLLVWLLPPGQADGLSAPSASPLSATRVPLFTRHCALLI